VWSALASERHTVDEVFITPSAAARDVELLRVAAAAGVRVTVVTDRVAASLSDTVTPQGLVAVVREPETDVPSLLAAHPRLLVVLVDVSEPGNAGTVIRTADAAGADGVVLAGESVDAHNPKCVRASSGSLFHLPVVRGADAAAVLDDVRRAGLAVVATVVDGDTDLYADEAGPMLRGPVAWLFGNEAHGVPDALAGQADLRVRIPISGRAESLNLAAAAAVCLYETARVRRVAP
jgi:TrmH family RNA methyltransferase